MNFEIIKIILSTVGTIIAKVFVPNLIAKFKKKTFYYTIETRELDNQNGIITITDFPIKRYDNLDKAQYISTVIMWMDKNHSLTQLDTDDNCPTTISIKSPFRIVSAKVLDMPQKANFCKASIEHTLSNCTVNFQYLDADKGILFIELLHSAPNNDCLSLEHNVNVQKEKRVYVNRPFDLKMAQITFVLIDLVALVAFLQAGVNAPTPILGILSQTMYCIIIVATLVAWIIINICVAAIPKSVKNAINKIRSNSRK